MIINKCVRGEKGGKYGDEAVKTRSHVIPCLPSAPGREGFTEK